MKKSILMAALGLLSLNTIAQDTLKEEGFIFTTVKENPITLLRTRTVPVHAGAIPDWHSSNPNCSAWAKANTTFLKCLSYTTPIWTVPTRQCVHMVTFRSHKAVRSTM